MNDPRQARWIQTCTFCPTLCLYTCPVSNGEGRDSVSPWGKMSLAGVLERGLLPLDAETASFAYKCLGCLACHTPCRHEVEVPEVLFGLRTRAVRNHVIPFAAEAFDPVRRIARETGESPLARLAAAVPADRFVEEAQVLLLPGLDTLADSPEVASDFFVLADRLGLDWIAVGVASVLDTGYAFWSAGHEAAFLERAHTFVNRVARYRRLIVLDPHDLYMLQVIYPRFELGPLPAVEFALAPLIPHLAGRSPTAPLPGRVRYHDPCYLGRHLAIFDEPRRVLARATAAPVGELRWHRRESYCCGGGGGLPVTSPTTAAHAAHTVTDNATLLGTDRLVTACASCVRMFRQAAPELCVQHIVSALAEAFGPEDEGHRDDTP